MIKFLWDQGDLIKRSACSDLCFAGQDGIAALVLIFKIILDRVRGIGSKRPFCNVACVTLRHKGQGIGVRISIVFANQLSRVCHYIAILIIPAEESISALIGCGESDLLAIDIIPCALSGTSLGLADAHGYVISISCIINLEHKISVGIDISAQHVLCGVKEGEMLKFLDLSGHGIIGRTCQNLNQRCIKIDLFGVFKVVFNGVGSVGILRPHCGIAFALLYLEGKFSFTAHRKVTLKPTEEYISGLIGCGECDLLAVGVCSSAGNRTASVIVYKRDYIIGISQIVHLQHKAAICIHVAACYTNGFVELEMLKTLDLCTYDSAGGAIKIFNDRVFISGFVYVFKIIFNLVRGVCTCFPQSLYCYVGGYGS